MSKAMPGQMTIDSLHQLVQELLDDGMPIDTPLFWYLGNDTFRLQAERSTGTNGNVETYSILNIEVKIALGGPA